jgi:hypothetical protein
MRRREMEAANSIDACNRTEARRGRLPLDPDGQGAYA